MKFPLKWVQVGDASVGICQCPDGSYRGQVLCRDEKAGLLRWDFIELYGPKVGPHWDLKRAAREACAFARCYTSDNRSDDVPEWAPTAEVADAILNATMMEDL